MKWIRNVRAAVYRGFKVKPPKIKPEDKVRRALTETGITGNQQSKVAMVLTEGILQISRTREHLVGKGNILPLALKEQRAKLVGILGERNYEQFVERLLDPHFR